MKLVVDASIAVKWFFTEVNSHDARQLLAPRIVLHAPDFILTEVANVIWKKARLNEIPAAQPYIEELAHRPDAVVLRASAELVMKAAALAVEIDHPVYDCLYLACAEAEAAPLVTADIKLSQRADEAYPAVDVWNIGRPEVARRIAAAATALVIQDRGRLFHGRRAGPGHSRSRKAPAVGHSYGTRWNGDHYYAAIGVCDLTSLDIQSDALALVTLQIGDVGKGSATYYLSFVVNTQQDAATVLVR